MKPCPCGYLGDSQADCRCSGDRVTNYRNKISGPLLDRIDLHVEVLRPPASALRGDGDSGESSSEVMERVTATRKRQLSRSGVLNAQLEGDELTSVCELHAAGWSLLETAAERFNLSARAHQRILRVARTIADLGGEEGILPTHIAEALSLRSLDRRAQPAPR